MQLSTFQKANNMTKNQKIVLGVGAIALAYYLFKDKFALYPKPEHGTSSGGIPIPRGQETPSTPTSDRQIECEKRLVEALKTMRPDNLQEFKSKFMSDCQNKEAIQYDACLDKQANVRYQSKLGFDLTIGQCMGCKSGEVFALNGTNGKVMCHKVLKGYV